MYIYVWKQISMARGFRCNACRLRLRGWCAACAAPTSLCWWRVWELGCSEQDLSSTTWCRDSHRFLIYFFLGALYNLGLSTFWTDSFWTDSWSLETKKNKWNHHLASHLLAPSFWALMIVINSLIRVVSLNKGALCAWASPSWLIRCPSSSSSLRSSSFFSSSFSSSPSISTITIITIAIITMTITVSL